MFTPCLQTHESALQKILENARKVNAGSMARGKWQHPQGKQESWSEVLKEATTSASERSQHSCGATHIVRRNTQKYRSVKCKNLFIILSKLNIDSSTRPSASGPSGKSDLELLLQLLSSVCVGGASSILVADILTAAPFLSVLQASSQDVPLSFVLCCLTCCISAAFFTHSSLILLFQLFHFHVPGCQLRRLHWSRV